MQKGFDRKRTPYTALTREEIQAVYARGVEAVIALVEQLVARIDDKCSTSPVEAGGGQTPCGSEGMSGLWADE